MHAARRTSRRMSVFAIAGIVVAQSFFGGLPIDGVHCDRMEGAVEHVHAYLQIFDRGRSVAIPENIGIPAGAGCLYWVHTHSGDGYIHIESPVKRPFTLGMFFDIWGPELSWKRAGSVAAPSGKRLSIWIDGRAWHGSDPRMIVLNDRETIVIQNGPPFAKPRTADWDKM